MRLNEPSARAKTNIVNTLLSDETRHHSAASSLHYKTKSNEKLTTPKPGKRKNQQQTEQQEQQQQHRRSAYPTRARESTGVPPKRYDIANIHDMDEYELMTALREDPEFAAAMQQYSEQAAQKESTKEMPTPSPKKPKSPPTGSRRKAKTKPRERYYRAADGNVQDLAEYPHHVRELMDSGVPVTQWVILLLLLCAGFYQMGRVLVGPQKKSTFGYSRNKPRGIDTSGNSKQKKKQKKKPESQRKLETTIEKRVVEKKSTISMPKLRSEQPMKVTPAKKKKKKRTDGAKNEGISHPDVFPSHESTHSEEGTTEKIFGAAIASLQNPPSNHTDLEDNGGGWETVTKSRKASIESDASEKPLESKPDPVPTLDTQGEKENVAVDDTQPTKAAKKRNKKKTKQQPDPTTAPVLGDASSTDEDAALALQLQKEEESLIKADIDSAEEVWEEVTTKKRKGQKEITA